MIKRRLPQLLAGKNIRSDCEVCGANNWQLPDDDNAELRLSIAEPSGQISIPGPSFNAHFMLCFNCGNVRLHASHIINPDRGR